MIMKYIKLVTVYLPRTLVFLATLVSLGVMVSTAWVLGTIAQRWFGWFGFGVGAGVVGCGVLLLFWLVGCVVLDLRDIRKRARRG